MRRFFLTVATVASVLTVTSCSDATGIRGDVVGSYELQSINGQFLPATFGDVTYTIGELELDSDGTFVDTYQYQVFGEGFVETEQTFGTWERDGSRIRFESDNGNVYFMERTSSNRLTYVDSDDGSRWVYTRF
jgi:hypothetical protein